MVMVAPFMTHGVVHHHYWRLSNRDSDCDCVAVMQSAESLVQSLLLSDQRFLGLQLFQCPSNTTMEACGTKVVHPRSAT